MPPAHPDTIMTAMHMSKEAQQLTEKNEQNFTVFTADQQTSRFISKSGILWVLWCGKGSMHELNRHVHLLLLYYPTCACAARG